jgi:hypothetical protein
MTKKILSVLVILLASAATFTILATFNKVSAHRDGCHRWHSCPSDTGSYVCGDLGYYSECPGPAPAPTTPAPAVSVPRPPVITKKTITADKPIAFRTIIKYTSNEYKGYSKIITGGVTGTRRDFTDISFTDGIETSRTVVKTEVVAQPIDQVVLKGKRQNPTAVVTTIKRTDKKDHFDIVGKYAGNSEVVLAIDGKRIKRAKTDDKGRFAFRKIKIRHAAKIEIYKRVNRKESKVSEKYEVNLKARSFISEYDKRHKKPATPIV